MNYLQHSNLKDSHAYLGASKYHWLNYDKDKLIQVYKNHLAKQRGTQLHAFAAQCIALNQKLPGSKTKTLNMYVNDAISFRMVPEQVLYYSENCFGTADAISNLDSVDKTGVLKVFDLKTGMVPAHVEQLLIYNALFCLEYKYEPKHLDIEDRIYQTGQIIAVQPDPNDIKAICNQIIEFDAIINEVKKEEGL